jgi:hypothetical protein
MKGAAMIVILAMAAIPASAPDRRPADRPEGGCWGAGGGAASASEGLEYRACLCCHDGMVAPEITPSDSRTRMRDPSVNHPVGMTYRTAYLRAPAGLVPEPMLDSRVRLVDGKVQCVSCHTASPEGKWGLAIPRSGSGLCLSCHVK